MMLGRRSRVAFTMLVSTIAVGCGGGGEPTATEQTATFQRIQEQVFNVSCISSSCHSSVGQAGELILEDGHSWAYLVNHTPSNPVSKQRGMMRVMPGQPEMSLLIAKLAPNLSAGEGLAMPYGGAPLDPGTVEVIAAWIEAGAPQQGVVPGDDGRDLNPGVDDGEISLPPPVRGVQVRVTSPALAPGTEETGCHYLKLPSDADIDVNRIQVAVSGGSHHIHLYRALDKTLDLQDHYEVCNVAVDFEVWEPVVVVQLRRTDWELPPGVAYHVRAHEQVLVQTHFVNVGSLETQGAGTAIINLQAAEPGTITTHAGVIFGQDKDVFVPKLSQTTTSGAECVFPKPITLMAETGHYHFRGRQFTDYRWDNGVRGEVIYQYNGYDDPPFTLHYPERPFAAGQGLQWVCYYENNTPNDYPFGPFTDANEHCNWFGFYYPTDSLDESITCVNQDGVATTTVRSSSD